MNAKSIQGLTMAVGVIIDNVARWVPTENIHLVPPAGNYRINGRKVTSEWKKKLARQIVKARHNMDVNEHVAEALLLGAPATTAEIASAWANLASESSVK